MSTLNIESDYNTKDELVKLRNDLEAINARANTIAGRMGPSAVSQHVAGLVKESRNDVRRACIRLNEAIGWETR